MNRTALIRFLTHKITLTTLSVAAIGIPTFISWSSSPAKSPIVAQATAPTPTLKNLQAAYNGESNAYVMYAAFAKKADQEGYKGVGSLFRAAARAEAIHRDNHAKVIREMGATPKNTITNPVVKSTAENLETGTKGESYESDTMYPDFIKQAKAENNQKAVQTFVYALDAEKDHLKLYSQAKNNLNNWKQARPFYVCSVSGRTTSEANQNNCTVNGVNKPIETIK